MRTSAFLTTSAAFTVCMLIVATSSTIAKDTKAEKKSDRTTETRNRSLTDRQTNRTKGPILKASEVIGMNIQNPQGENVGEINDIVLDANSGKTRYAAVTYGGFVGIGDKLFAVPWEAFQCRKDKEDPDEHVLVLNVTEKQLENAEGFDQENWPDFADRNFTDGIDKQYGVARRNRHRDREGNVDVNVGQDGVDVDVDRRNEDK